MVELFRELPGRFRRVDEYPAAGFQTCRDRRGDECRVEHDDVIGLIDQVAIGDGLPGVAAEGLDRRTGTFSCIKTKGLHRQALQKPRRSDQLGEGHASLATTAMNPYLDHYVRSRPVSGRGPPASTLT